MQKHVIVTTTANVPDSEFSKEVTLVCVPQAGTEEEFFRLYPLGPIDRRRVEHARKEAGPAWFEEEIKMLARATRLEVYHNRCVSYMKARMENVPFRLDGPVYHATQVWTAPWAGQILTMMDAQVGRSIFALEDNNERDF